MGASRRARNRDDTRNARVATVVRSMARSLQSTNVTGDPESFSATNTPRSVKRVSTPPVSDHDARGGSAGRFAHV